MATVIKLKKSQTAGAAPTTSNLVAGEVQLIPQIKKYM